MQAWIDGDDISFGTTEASKHEKNKSAWYTMINDEPILALDQSKLTFQTSNIFLGPHAEYWDRVHALELHHGLVRVKRVMVLESAPSNRNREHED
ncbi:hypothetical protein Syun_006903 [Stephania yunnanensis]|uniref:Uncharacterized protein n=1 Tax=Stephania yunnanensis TaxID=152371 RepID=A0AAP0KZ74_9MAGN